MSAQPNSCKQPMSNLPPGVTPSDIDDHYGPVIPDHRHEWYQSNDGTFFLEDGRAIFPYHCEWVETVSVAMGEHGIEDHAVGAECEQATTVSLVARDATDSELEAIEAAFRNGEIDVEQIDPPAPDDEDGTLVVTTDNCRVRYA